MNSTPIEQAMARKRVYGEFRRTAAKLFAAGLLFCSAAGMSQPAMEPVRFSVTNPASVKFTDYCVRVDDAGLLEKLNALGAGEAAIKTNGSAIGWQGLDNNGDGKIDAVILVQDFAAGETKTFDVEKSSGPAPAAVKRTQAEISIKEGGAWKEDTSKKDGRGQKQMIYEGGAFKNVTELKVPPEHTDHSFYIRYEGPGWESDLVGYRMYLDWRNAMDVNGKKTTAMVQQNMGLDGFESYHAMADWGMDVLKVGDSLGIGSVGYWDGEKANRVAVTKNVACQISANGDLYSQVDLQYYGWQVGGKTTDLTDVVSISAGSRLTRQDLTMNPSLDNLCTGLNILPDTEVIAPDEAASGWTWLATWGKQSLNNDQLGMAIFYDKAQLVSQTKDKLNHVVVLKPADGKLTYYFAAAWENETKGIKTLDEFKQYLHETAVRLHSAPMVKYPAK